MSRLARFLSALALSSLPALAQQVSLLDRMAGHWLLQGTIHGTQTTHDVDMDWVLNRGYIRIHEVSREKDAAGQPAYEAIVFLGQDAGASTFTCLWLDSTVSGGLKGEALARCARSGDTLPFLFTFKGGESLHTTFAYAKDQDSWQWIMDGDKDGKLTPFARLTLTRKSPTP